MDVLIVIIVTGYVYFANESNEKSGKDTRFV